MMWASILGLGRMVFKVARGIFVSKLVITILGNTKNLLTQRAFESALIQVLSFVLGLFARREMASAVGTSLVVLCPPVNARLTENLVAVLTNYWVKRNIQTNCTREILIIIHCIFRV